MATASPGSMPRICAARRYGSGCGLGSETSSPLTMTSNASNGMAATICSAMLRTDIVTRAVRTPRSRSDCSSSRAPGRHGTPSPASFSRTRSVSPYTISSAGRSTPRDWRIAAEVQSPCPTSSRPSSWVQVPPNERTSSCSDAIQ